MVEVVPLVLSRLIYITVAWALTAAPAMRTHLVNLTFELLAQLSLQTLKCFVGQLLNNNLVRDGRNYVVAVIDGKTLNVVVDD